MNKIDTKFLVKTAMIAAIYAVCTVAIAPLSFGAIQFRFSEILVLLAFLDKDYIPGLVLGCAVANLFSPLGLIDVFVGSFATFLSVYMISKSKSLFVASLWPTLNCVFVGAELYFITKMPFILTTLQVALGEFVVVTLIGFSVFKVLMNNERLTNLLKLK